MRNIYLRASPGTNSTIGMSTKVTGSKRKAEGGPQNHLGLEVWIEIDGKKAVEEEVDGKRVVIMEASEPNTTIPYSIFVKNHTARDLYIRLDTDKANGDGFYTVRKRTTGEWKSFNGMLLGFKVTRAGTQIDSFTSASDFAYFSLDVRSVTYGELEWHEPPNRDALTSSSDVFGSLDGACNGKKIELVSAGQDQDVGWYTREQVGPKLGEVELYYASVTQMANVRDRRTKPKHAAAKIEKKAPPPKAKTEGGGSKCTSAKGTKAGVLDLTSDVTVLDITSDAEQEEE